jgi:hypothetical protein
MEMQRCALSNYSWTESARVSALNTFQHARYAAETATSAIHEELSGNIDNAFLLEYGI